MRKLTSFVALYWTIVFALLALLCISGSHGVAAALSVLGASIDAPQIASLDSILIAAPLATAFMLVAVLFAWALIEMLVGAPRDANDAHALLRMAFAGSGIVLQIVLIAGTAQGVHCLFLATAVQLAALLVSYLVMVGEGWPNVVPALPDTPRETARSMARDAGYTTRLARMARADVPEVR